MPAQPALCEGNTGFGRLDETRKFGLTGFRGTLRLIGSESVPIAELRAIDAAVRTNPGQRLLIVSDSGEPLNEGAVSLPQGSGRYGKRSGGLTKSEYRVHAGRLMTRATSPKSGDSSECMTCRDRLSTAMDMIAYEDFMLRYSYAVAHQPSCNRSRSSRSDRLTHVDSLSGVIARRIFGAAQIFVRAHTSC